MEQETETTKEQLIAELKEAARIISYQATLRGRPEEVGDSIVLSLPYSICRKFADHEFLVEIIRPSVEEGQKLAQSQSARLWKEKEEIRQEGQRLARFDHELSAERERLSKAEARLKKETAEEYKKLHERASKAGHALSITESRLKLLKEELEVKERKLDAIGRLEKARRQLEQDKQTMQERLQRLECRLNDEQASNKRLDQELKARKQADGNFGQLAARAVKFCLRLAGFAACALFLLLHSQQAFLSP